jgi:hypothetical protein
MWARAGRWAKITTAGLERLVSPDPAEALALSDEVQPSCLPNARAPAVRHSFSSLRSQCRQLPGRRPVPIAGGMVGGAAQLAGLNPA